MNFSIRSHLYGLPLITILVFAVSLLLGLGKLLEEGRENRNDIKEPLYWAASQTLVEYWRFVNALDRYVATPDAANPDAVMLRLNILWSRIGLYQTGEIGKRLRMIEGATETIPALAGTLREIEPLLPTLNADNRSAIAVMRDRLASYAHPLQQMAQQTNLFEQGHAVDLREGQGQTRRLILALLFGVILSGTPLIILLFRETRATSRLLIAAQAAKATAQDAAERLGAILDNSVASIITIDAQGTIMSFNPAAERLFGYSAADAVSKKVTLLMPEEDAVVHQRHQDTHFGPAARKAFGRTREVIARRADGSVFPIEIAVGEMRHGGRTHFVGFIIDISERKKAENALKSSEQRFRDIAEIAGDWIWETDKDGRYTYFSSQMEKVTGLNAEDLLGKTPRDLPWADDNDSKWWRLHETISAQKPFRDLSFEISAPNIEARQVRISGKPIFNGMGEFVGYRGTGTDVSAQIEAEREAAQKTSLLHTTFENISQGIHVVDADGRLAAFNSRFLELFELPLGTVVTGMPADQIIRYLAARGEYGPGDADELAARHTSVLQHHEPRTDEHSRPNGTILEWRTNPLPGGGFTTTYTDITNRKRVEEKFRQAQKMEAIGRLTAGISHEFNNLLTAIAGFSHLMLRHADEPDTVREWSEDIIGAADQGAELTKQLLNFSHSQAPSPKLVRIGTVLHEAIQLLRPTIGELISVNCNFADEWAQVRIDPGRLSQALFNIVINAKDAMPQGGTLTVACRVVDLDDAATAGLDHAPAARYVMVSVSDTGTGINEDTLEKMFEPFFTTKEVGKGTGLGLTMAYGAVQQSGGVIAVESELGAGTSFNIYLPLAESSDETDDETEDVVDAEPTGSETVLIVEDESAVRRMVRFTLEDLGYQVLMAEDGTKGLDVFLGHDGRIDLLLSDLRMPGMNGWQLASELIALRSDLKVLYMTGHDVSTHDEEIKNVTTLLKPLNPCELAHAVRGALDASDRPSGA